MGAILKYKIRKGLPLPAPDGVVRMSVADAMSFNPRACYGPQAPRFFGDIFVDRYRIAIARYVMSESLHAWGDGGSADEAPRPSLSLPTLAGVAADTDLNWPTPSTPPPCPPPSPSTPSSSPLPPSPATTPTDTNGTDGRAKRARDPLPEPSDDSSVEAKQRPNPSARRRLNFGAAPTGVPAPAASAPIAASTPPSLAEVKSLGGKSIILDSEVPELVPSIQPTRQEYYQRMAMALLITGSTAGSAASAAGAGRAGGGGGGGGGANLLGLASLLAATTTPSIEGSSPPRPPSPLLPTAAPSLPAPVTAVADCPLFPSGPFRGFFNQCMCGWTPK